MSGTADLDDVRREIEALGRRVMVSAIDVRDRAGVESLLARAVSEWGRLDIVVANAGVSPPAGDISSISHDRWADVIGINLTGVFHTVAAALPHLKAGGRGGSVIITSSAAASKNAPGLSDDCTDVFRALMPMGEPWVEPADVAEAVLYLASPASRWISGAVLPVNQGSAVRRF